VLRQFRHQGVELDSEMSKGAKLILASGSARRRELLRHAGIEFTVEAPQVREERRAGEAAEDFARRLAREKARVVLGRHPRALVLGADTVVVIAEQILGKPRDRQHAARMLRRLSGRVHRVISGVCLAGEGFEEVASASTSVHMRPLEKSEIRAYVSTGEPLDKAGAYAIQGIASRWIDRIEGCYFNVVGLPLPLVYRLLRKRGWQDKD